MAWLYVCGRCRYRVISRKKKDAEKFMDIHIWKSHISRGESEPEVGVTTIPNEDYEIMKNIPGFPALFV